MTEFQSMPYEARLVVIERNLRDARIARAEMVAASVRALFAGVAHGVRRLTGVHPQAHTAHHAAS